MPAATTAQFGALLPAADVAQQRTDELVATLGADTLANNTGGFAIKNTNDLGKGIQRGIVQQALERHPLVESFADDPRAHLGATIATLRSGPG